MVSTLQPFACTASIRQPRTRSPSTRTVQAPHTQCSRVEKNEALPGGDLSSCQTNNCIIAVTAGELDEHCLVGGREFGRGENFRGPQIGFEEPFEERACLYPSFALLSCNDEGGVERDCAGRILGGRVGERETAAQRAAVADRRVRDVRRRLGKERGMFPYVRRSFDLRVDRKSTRLNSSHGYISYAVFCLK